MEKESENNEEKKRGSLRRKSEFVKKHIIFPGKRNRIFLSKTQCYQHQFPSLIIPQVHLNKCRVRSRRNPGGVEMDWVDPSPVVSRTRVVGLEELTPTLVEALLGAVIPG